MTDKIISSKEKTKPFHGVYFERSRYSDVDPLYLRVDDLSQLLECDEQTARELIIDAKRHDAFTSYEYKSEKDESGNVYFIVSVEALSQILSDIYPELFSELGEWMDENRYRCRRAKRSDEICDEYYNAVIELHYRKLNNESTAADEERLDKVREEFIRNTFSTESKYAPWIKNELEYMVIPSLGKNEFFGLWYILRQAYNLGSKVSTKDERERCLTCDLCDTYETSRHCPHCVKFEKERTAEQLKSLGVKCVDCCDEEPDGKLSESDFDFEW